MSNCQVQINFKMKFLHYLNLKPSPVNLVDNTGLYTNSKRSIQGTDRTPQKQRFAMWETSLRDVVYDIGHQTPCSVRY